jgi:hypothetical protein
MDDDQLVQKVRAAIGDRAIYLALLVRSFAKVLPMVEVERLARQAIHEFGMLKGKADQTTMTPQKWVDLFVSSGGADLFDGRIFCQEGFSEQQMTYCPLIAGWQEVGCSEEEIDLLCDIAMEVDRGRADFHGIPYEINERLAKGDSFCRLVLKENN